MYTTKQHWFCQPSDADVALQTGKNIEIKEDVSQKMVIFMFKACVNISTIINNFRSYTKVQVGNDQEKARSERNVHSNTMA